MYNVLKYKFKHLVMETLLKIFTYPAYILLPIQDKNWEIKSNLKTISASIIIYFALISGIIYDVINEPASMGQKYDKKFGGLRPVAFLRKGLTN